MPPRTCSTGRRRGWTGRDAALRSCGARPSRPLPKAGSTRMPTLPFPWPAARPPGPATASRCAAGTAAEAARGTGRGQPPGTGAAQPGAEGRESARTAGAGRDRAARGGVQPRRRRGPALGPDWRGW
ncbi:hypothetical protein G6F40_015963 [Rhizopus arrhizus]|nr:hypothetical protein G6F40_015963 [Rhizopus arrhizus]